MPFSLIVILSKRLKAFLQIKQSLMVGRLHEMHVSERSKILLVLVVYFYELIVYMLFERNAFDSIAFFLSEGVCSIAWHGS